MDVRAASLPAVENDPNIHLAIKAQGGALLIAVARHSDASLVSILAPGLCAGVASKALAAAGATAMGLRVVLSAVDDMADNMVFLAADRAALEDHEDHGTLVLLFNPGLDSSLVQAFAPGIASAMRSRLTNPPAGAGPALSVPKTATVSRTSNSALAAQTNRPGTSTVKAASWTGGLLADLVAFEGDPAISTSWMSQLLATPGALKPGTELSRLDRQVLRSLRSSPEASLLSPADLLVVVASTWDLPKSVAVAWKTLRADLGTAWTALEDAAWIAEMPLVRRSARVEQGFEVCQLALRGHGVGVIGPVGVGVTARSALHRAALALLELLADPDPRSEVRGWEDWSRVSGLVERVAEPVAVEAVSGSGAGRRSRRQSPAGMKRQDGEPRRTQEESEAEIAHLERRYRRVEAAKSDIKQRLERVRALKSAGAEQAAFIEASTEPGRRRDKTFGPWVLLNTFPPGGRPGAVDGAAHQVGMVDGCALWAARIRVAQAGEDLMVQGPVQLSETAALDAAAVLTWQQTGNTEAVGVVEVHDLLGTWHLLAPQASWPCVAELAKAGEAGVLPGFDKTVDKTGTSAVVEMSARTAGGPVRARAVGESEEDATEQCARILLGALSGERGFGPLDWTAELAGQRLDRFFGEPWLSGRKLRTGRTRGDKSRRVELSGRVGDRDVRVAVVAEAKEIAELAAPWLLVQEIAARVPKPALLWETRNARQALTRLREDGVLGPVEFTDGPGGEEAVLAHAALGDVDLWAGGPDHDGASAGLLAAARCRVLAPEIAEESGIGVARPGWMAPSAPEPPPDGDGLTPGQGLLAEVRRGARLCVVGVDGGPVGFVAVDPATARKAKSGDGRGWRVWSERGALTVPGPVVAVADAARVLLAGGPEEGWDVSAVAWRRVLRFGCQVVAAGQVRPGVRADGRAVWRPGPLGDEQHALLARLAGMLPPWAHSAALSGRREGMLPARSVADLVLGELADALVRGPGVAAVWGANALTAQSVQPARGAVAQWLDALEEIADAVPPPGVVLQVMPPPRPQAPAASLQVNVRLRPPGRGAALVTLPDLRASLGAEHPAVLRACRALRKAAMLWPALEDAAADDDRLRVAPGQAALLLGHLGRVLRRAGIEVVWPGQWADRLRATVVASGPADGGLSLDQLVDYRWQVRVDGSALSQEECEQIAEAAGTLVWLRSRWVLVDEVTAERARGRRIRRRVPAGEALSAVLLGSVELEDGESVDLVADGELADLAALLTGACHTPVAPPQGLAATLWPYQATGLSWLANTTANFGALLGDEMGLGKTIQAIALMLHRAQTGLSRGLPNLVVVPASMVLTWVRQVKTFAPGLPVRAYHGTGRTLAGLAADEIVVTSYGTLVEDRTPLAGQTFSVVVADEAQAIKNAASQRSQALAAVPALTRLGLTGTPVENRIRDLGNLMHWTNPRLFSPTEFQRTFGALDHGPDPKLQAALNRVVGSVMLRRLKTDPQVALDLPDKIDSTHVLALTPTQMGLYTRTARIAMEAVRTGPLRERAGAVFRLITQLRQICNSPQHLRIGSADSGRLDAALAGYDPARASREAGKFAALDDLVPSILDSGESMVVFTEYRVMAMLLHRHAAAWGCRPLLHVGSMTTGERDTALTAFRERRGRLLIVTYGSGGTGLDLTTASHAILADQHFNPAVTAQAIDRLHRPGQRNTVHVHRLQTAGTIEDKIATMLARKSQLLDALSPRGFDPALLSDDDLRALLVLGAAA
ncbi:DEAD/DEAH box helicase [Streptomyces sp. NPDC048717]|uniref:DEAD/DEAH box helicase n=1 Tax=Streptomyces sp. NPDC048717 TaxID=3154928 RepID=UPI0034414D27